MSYFSLMQNDRLPVVRAELTDASGAINLTNSSCFFVYRGKYQTGVAPTSGVADIISPTGGILEYSWTTGDTASPGIYYCYWQVSGSNRKWSSYPNDSYLTYIVNPQL